MDNKHALHLEVSTRPDGIIYLKLGNPLSSNHIEELKGWAKDVMTLVINTHHKIGKKVLILGELTGLHTYDSEAISILSELMKQTEPHVEKTATFGIDKFIRIAQDTLIAMTSRDPEKFKAFSTEEEALTWLRS